MGIWRKAIIAVVCGAAAMSAGDAMAETYVPLRAQAVRESVGVNTHIRYTDGAYAHIPDVIRALDYLDVRHVRDGVPEVHYGGGLPLAEYIWLAKARIRFNLVIGGGDYDPSGPLVGLRKLEAAYPGAIESIESFNEVNNEPVRYKGLTGNAAALAAQKDTLGRLRALPEFDHVPFYDLTGDGLPPVLDGRADYHTAHIYAQNGNQPGDWMDESGRIPDGKPWVITEFGYASNPQSGWLVIGVGEDGQAKGVLNGILDAVQNGASRIYLYELLDEKPDPKGENMEMHFGLFTYANKPKPAAKALRNLLRIVADPDAAALTFTPHPLDLKIGGAPETLRVLTIQKASGETQILLWNEVAFWDREHGRPVENAPAPVKVTLPAGQGVRALYDPLRQEKAVRFFNGEGELTVDVPDYPVIVEIAP